MLYRVRSAQVKDLPQVADVLTGSFYPSLGWRRCLYPILRFSIYEDLRQRLQNNQRYYRCLAAITPASSHDQNRVVGTVEMSYRRYSWRAFNEPQQIYLSNLAVQENHRRRGVARMLLQFAEQQALEWGFRNLYLHVMADNRRARQLYQQMGYEVQYAEMTLLSLLNVQPRRLLLKKVVSQRTPANSVNPKAPQTSLS